MAENWAGTPRDWATNEIVTEAMMDTEVRDRAEYLKARKIEVPVAQKNRMLQTGKLLVGTVNTSGETRVNFPVAFSSQDDIHVTVTCTFAKGIDEQIASYRVDCGVYGTDTTGFTVIYLNQWGSTVYDVTFCWMATGAA